MKKLLNIFTVLCMVMALSCTGAFAAETTADAYIVYPSETHLNIAPGRDFYVFARVSDEYRDSVVSASIAIKDETGKTVREVHSGAADAFKTDYSGINAFNTEQDSWLMPDILYDSKNPASLAYAWNKCYIKEGYAIGFITGGVNKVITDFRNEDGTAFENFEEGAKYTINVMFTLRDGMTLTCKETMTAQTAAQKVLSRFSPDNYLTMVKEYAGQNDMMVYLDPFAGYWTAANIIEGQSSNKYFAEIKQIWQTADAMEYEKGNVFFFLYNVSSGCATNRTELTKLQVLGDIDDRMTVLRLSLGEPSLNYTTITGEQKSESSEFVTMVAGDKLDITRVEERKAVLIDDNKYIAYTTDQVKNVDLNVSDGVNMDVGDTMTIYGVAAPIQNTAEELAKHDGEPSIGNCISKVNYTFTEGNKVIYNATKDVTLTRTLAEGWDAVSIYEFAHSFVITADMVGELSVNMAALDIEGNPVYGAAEDFVLTVSPEGTFFDVSSNLPNATGVYALENAGVVNGYGNGQFLPYNNLTVGEAVTMIARAEGVKADYSTETGIICADWLRPYATWAAEKGFIRAESFSESSFVTAAQLDAMIESLGVNCNLTGDGHITRIQASPYIVELLK